MKFKQSFSRHITVSWFIWTSIIAYIIISWWYSSFELGYMLVVGAFFSFVTIPALYMHIEYALRNVGEEIEFANGEIVIRKKGTERRYLYSELEELIVYKSASLDAGGIPLSAMEYYYYVQIVAKSGEEIIITCLMGRKIDEIVRQQLRDVPYTRVKFIAAFCWKMKPEQLLNKVH